MYNNMLIYIHWLLILFKHKQLKQYIWFACQRISVLIIHHRKQSSHLGEPLDLGPMVLKAVTSDRLIRSGAIAVVLPVTSDRSRLGLCDLLWASAFMTQMAVVSRPHASDVSWSDMSLRATTLTEDPRTLYWKYAEPPDKVPELLSPVRNRGRRCRAKP